MRLISHKCMAASCKVQKRTILQLTSICIMQQQASLDTCSRHESPHCTCTSIFYQDTIDGRCESMWLSACTDFEKRTTVRIDRGTIASGCVPHSTRTHQTSRNGEQGQLLILRDVNNIRHDSLDPLKSSKSLDRAEKVVPSPVQHALNGEPQIDTIGYQSSPLFVLR